MVTRRKRTKLNIPMCLAGILLCLTLISVHLTSGLYARYTTTAEGSDLARVAAFKVTEDRTTFSSGVVLGVTPGKTMASILVKNESEVAIRYTITVTNVTENLPLSFRVGDGTESAVTATGSWSMPVKSTQECQLSIMWDAAGAEAYMGMVDKLSITLTAEQID